MYAAELAPARIRGALVMGWQLYVICRIFYMVKLMIQLDSFWDLHRFLRQCRRKGQ